MQNLTFEHATKPNLTVPNQNQWGWWCETTLGITGLTDHIPEGRGSQPNPKGGSSCPGKHLIQEGWGSDRLIGGKVTEVLCPG